MEKPQSVVITGSTRGIGFGLAREFLRRGHRVAVNGRGQASVEQAVAQLAALGEVIGRHGDVRRRDDLQGLWDTAVEAFGRVDIWINNAALAPHRRPFHEVPAEELAATLDTNLAGAMQGAQIALHGMLAQGGGKIYLFEGFGSDGMVNPGLTTYGTTKRALHYFARSLAKEYEDSPILIGALNPGMVPTDLLLYSSRSDDPAAWAHSKRIMNRLGDTVETVTPWLVEQALENRKQGARIVWMTRRKALARFLLPKYGNRHLVEDFEADLDHRPGPRLKH